jgi:hypothetical protein
MKPTKIEYYNSIENLPLYNWDKYLTTKDNNWFVMGFNGRQKKIDNEDLPHIEVKIQDEYLLAVNDRVFNLKLQKWAIIENLTTKYNIVSLLIKVIWDGFAPNQMEMRYKFIDKLSLLGFPMEKVNTLDGDKEELLRISTEVEGIKNKIILLQNELKGDSQKESSSLQKQLQIVTLGLGYNYRLDPRQVMLAEWLEMCKLMEEKAKNN